MGSQIQRRSDDAFFKPPREFPARSGGGKGFPIGRRTRERQAGNRDLNKLPREVTHQCELRIGGVCIGNVGLQWCHPTKSRYIVTKKDWRTAARGCAACHDHIEKLSHPKMKAFVMGAIARRKPTCTS